MTKNVILSGYYGMCNAGDDAFLRVARRHAPLIYGPAAEYKVTARRGAPFPIDDARPIFVSLPVAGIWTGLEYLYASDASYLFGGGSVFHTPRQLARNRRILDWSGRRDHVALGVSIGPFTGAGAAEECGSVLRRLAFAGVRDTVSLERARQIAPDANVQLTFDLAPLLLDDLADPLPERDPSMVTVALCSRERLRGEGIEPELRRCDAVAGALAELAARGTVERVVLVEMNGHPKLGDQWVHDRLAEAIRKRTSALRIERFEYRPRPLEYVRLFASSSACITMRLHGAVFSFCAETPVLTISYHEKNNEWAARVGQPQPGVIDCRTVSSEAILAGLHTVARVRPTLTPHQAREAAMRNFTLAADAIRTAAGSAAPGRER